MWKSLPADRAGEAKEAGLACLGALLKAGRYDGLVGVVPDLASAMSQADAGEIRRLLAAHLELLLGGKDDQRVQVYLIELDRLDGALLGEALQQSMERARTRIASPNGSGADVPVEG